MCPSKTLRFDSTRHERSPILVGLPLTTSDGTSGRDCRASQVQLSLNNSVAEDLPSDKAVNDRKCIQYLMLSPNVCRQLR